MKAYFNARIITGGILIITFCLVSLLAPYIAPYGYWEQNILEAREPPSWNHLFGTDSIGRDVFSRVVYASRVSMLVAFIAAVMAGLLGIGLGILGGYFSGWIDRIVQNFIDLAWTVPTLLLGLALTLITGPGELPIIVAVLATWWPQYARVIRNEVYAIKEEEYVLAARSFGSGHTRIITKEILPNVVAPVIVLVSTTVGRAIIIESTLSFLGVGVRPPKPSWGLMLANAREFIGSCPWMTIPPGIAISLAVLGFCLLGDGFRDLLDPYMRD